MPFYFQAVLEEPAPLHSPTLRSHLQYSPPSPAVPGVHGGEARSLDGLIPGSRDHALNTANPHI